MNSRFEYQLNPLTLTSSKNSLPQIVNIPHLSSGRKDEICRYVNFIKKSNSTKRCFQRLPPAIRRRSMSYNVYRAPRKIRPTLLYEMAKAPPRISRKRRKERKKLPWIKRNLLLRAINRENFCGKEILPFNIRNSSDLSTAFRKKGQRSTKLPFNQFKWMESHLYHSKRFKMCDAFGYKLPICSTSKRNRKIYRAFKHEFVVHDSSYLQLFELNGVKEDISILFKLCNFNVDFLFNNDYFNTSYRGGGFLFKLKDNILDKISINTLFPEKTHFYSWERIAPIEFLWSPFCKNCGYSKSLWVWIHPIASHQQFFYWEKCIEIFGLDVCINLVEDVNRFEFRGPKSLNFIESFRCKHPLSQIEKFVAEQDFVNSIHIKVPLTYSSNKLPNEVFKPNKYPALKDNFMGCSLFCKKYREAIRSQFFSSKNLLYNKQTTKCKKYHSPLINILNYRSRKRKNIKTLLSNIMERNEKLNSSLGSNSTRKRGQQKFIVSKALIIVHQGSNFGFDLLFPRGLNSSLILRYIHFYSAQIIGIGERRKLFTQFGIPMFPFDFIETLSNQKLQISNPIYTESKELFEELSNEVINFSNFLKTPPSKRINYFFNKIEFPFLINWNKILNYSCEEFVTFQNNFLILNQIVSTSTANNPDKITEVENYNIFVARVGYRGTRKEYKNVYSYILENPIMKLRTLVLVKITSQRKINHKAHIYMCNKDDIKEIKRKNYLTEEPNKYGKISLKENATNQLEFFNFSNPGFSTMRKLVGIVTSGGYSMLLRKGIGIGYISLFSFDESCLEQNKESFFWIRDRCLRYTPVNVEKYSATNLHFNIY
ncbi:Ribonuclease P/MRP subunit POP1 with POPLD domain [Cryptosporidium hominis]|uniref:Ribonuclease P/MRP subunit POP1 with POPLD domain n=2 Tax=Cryptosporidium hominis TaxID=237895 RepID=A0ABX5BAF9_CRYHO|nr:Ribonuclease P/MRP subunit POP1 with POPLD domain [Cryptosporidium hominis]|eukprot:PPS93748.1 Ribonuclease P/MRP subunit POP1 with POPLD domain [Cryptosporidium hominis]